MQLQNYPCSLEDGWTALRRDHLARIESVVDSMDIRAPLSPIFSPSEFLAGYSIVYSMCTAPESKSEEPLYLRVCQLYSDFLRRKVSIETPAAVTAESLVDTWMRYRAYESYVSALFSYLDRFYVRWAAQPLLNSKALEVFQSAVFEKHKTLLKCAILDLLDTRRSSADGDELLIGAIAQMYHQLDGSGGLQYRDELEGEIVARALKYYNTMAPLWAQELNLVDYVSIIEHCMEQERSDCAKWFKKSTETILLTSMSRGMLTNQMDTILNKMSELEALLHAGNEADLQLIYKLLRHDEAFIHKMGYVLKNSIQNASVQLTVLDILEHWLRYQGLLERCFSNEVSQDDHYDTSQDATRYNTFNDVSLVDMINASSVSNHSINSTLANAVRDSFKGLIAYSEDFIKALVDHWDSVIINGPDYKVRLLNCCSLFDLLGLASRLLFGRSSLDVERMSVSMLEERSCAEEVSSLHRMIKEVTEGQLSRQMYTIRLISRSSWPCLQDYRENIQLNEDFEHALAELYQSLKYQDHRKVEFNRMLGRVELELNCDTEAKTLTCDLTQASALLLFDGSSIPLEELAARLSVSTASLISILQPLVDKNVLTLSKNASVCLNMSFPTGTDVTVNAMPEYFSSQHSTNEGDALDMNASIDSSIVSLLKRAKTLDREELLLQLSRFSREDVLSRIETLNRKEYLSISDDTISYIP